MYVQLGSCGPLLRWGSAKKKIAKDKAKMRYSSHPLSSPGALESGIINMNGLGVDMRSGMPATTLALR